MYHGEIKVVFRVTAVFNCFCMEVYVQHNNIYLFDHACYHMSFWHLIVI